MSGGRPPVLLTIKGVTMSAIEWSRQPGAAKYATILARLHRHGYEPERAVFNEAQRGGQIPNSAVVVYRKKRAAVALPPAPRIANPFPPCLGGFRSYPIEALEILRRVA